MDLKSIDPKNVNITVGGKFRLKELIGKGSFGQIFRAIVKGSDSEVAVKIEKKQTNGYLSLSKEARVIADLNAKAGFPNLYAYGREDSLNYMATTLLGPNLEKNLRMCGGKFPMKTVLMLADQILTRIETLHEHSYVHRDIKPENFVMGLGTADKTLYIIDFGLAHAYQDSQGKHIPFKDKKGLVGTARYASINAHIGSEQSRRDDLESIGYVLIYFLKGKLPWQNTKAPTKQEKYQIISDIKRLTSIETLCKDLPDEFTTYMTLVKALTFQEIPNYKHLRKLFRMLFVESGFDYDYNYGWIKRQATLSSSKSSKTSKFKMGGDPQGLMAITRKKERFPTFARPNKILSNFSKMDDVVEEEKLEDSNEKQDSIPKQTTFLNPLDIPVKRKLLAPSSTGTTEKISETKSEVSSRNSSKDLNVSIKKQKQNEDEEIPIELGSYVSPSRKFQEISNIQRGVTMSPEIQRRFKETSSTQGGNKRDSFRKQMSNVVRPTIIDENSLGRVFQKRLHATSVEPSKVDSLEGDLTCSWLF